MIAKDINKSLPDNALHVMLYHLAQILIHLITFTVRNTHFKQQKVK